MLTWMLRIIAVISGVPPVKTAVLAPSRPARSSPLMAPLIPVARPRLPAASAILPYLKEIDANRWYTNHGLLWLRFQGMLADFWGIGSGEVALVANATIGLAMALRA